MRYIKNHLIVAKALPVLNTHFSLTCGSLATSRSYSTRPKNKLWDNIEFPLKDNLFNIDILNTFISKFYNSIVSNIKDDQHIIFIFKIVLINNDIKSTTKLLKINKEGKDSLINYISNAIELTSDNYDNPPFKALIISYGIRNGKVDNLFKDEPVEDSKISFHIYYNHKLPIVKNIEEYGNIIEKTEDKIIISLFNRKGEILSIQKVDNQNNVKYFKNGKLMYEWTDHLREDGSIIREIGKTTILWKDGNIIWTKMLKVTRPISKKKISPNPNNLFITMDIETISQIVNNNNSILIPYLICWYDGKRDIKHSYLIENGNIKNTIYNIMRDICIRKYKNYKIYMHNFSKFDALFLIKYLVEIG